MYNGIRAFAKAYQARKPEMLPVAAHSEEKTDQKLTLRLRNGLVVLFGPFIGLSFIVLLPLIPVIFVLALIPRIALGSAALENDEARMCLGCHSAPMSKTFMNGEKVSIQLQEKDFAGTVHSFASCTNCHADVQLDKHPSAKYASKMDLMKTVSKNCRMCHDDRQLLARPVHKMTVNRANAPPCAGCHGAHAIQRTGSFKAKKDISEYCLTCHKKDISTMIRGERVSLSVDVAAIRKSVHSKHACTDCHSAFSTTNHPVQEFASRRELSIALSSACRNCHADKMKQMEGSIHASMLAQGNLRAPVCTDCHSSHAVGKKAIADTLAGVPCKRCHESVFNMYRQSMHGMAKAQGNTQTPICSSCHFAHEVKSASMPEQIKAACLGCHKQAIELHSRWLPNAAAHLEAVSCPSCHVPQDQAEAGRSIFLYVSDKATGTQLGEAQVEKILGEGNGLKSCEQSGNCISPDEFWGIYRKLSKDSSVQFTGRMKLGSGLAAHRLALKEHAVRKCEQCHSADSNFFTSVKMAIMKTDGRMEVYNVDPKVLSSYMAILPLSKFYAIGSTRVRVLDYLGILFVVGGASVPAAHLTLRFLTRGIRKRRKGGH
jgi:predicted CXXCH cytochrome family protein